MRKKKRCERKKDAKEKKMQKKKRCKRKKEKKMQKKKDAKEKKRKKDANEKRRINPTSFIHLHHYALFDQYRIERLSVILERFKLD